MAGPEDILRGLMPRIVRAEGGDGPRGSRSKDDKSKSDSGQSSLGHDNVPDTKPKDNRGGHTDDKELKRD